MSVKEVTIQDIRDYSKFLDENRDDFFDLPYRSVFQFLVGSDEPPESRTGDELAVWQIIDDPDESLSVGRVEWLSGIVDTYPKEDLQDIKETRREQEILCLLLEDVTFWKPHWRFVGELTDTVLEDRKPISEKQEHWLRHYVYKYREQIRENIIYHGKGSSELYEYLGYDEVPEYYDRKESEFEDKIEELIESCEDDYEG